MILFVLVRSVIILVVFIAPVDRGEFVSAVLRLFGKYLFNHDTNSAVM